MRDLFDCQLFFEVFVYILHDTDDKLDALTELCPIRQTVGQEQIDQGIHIRQHGHLCPIGSLCKQQTVICQPPGFGLHDALMIFVHIHNQRTAILQTMLSASNCHIQSALRHSDDLQQRVKMCMNTGKSTIFRTMIICKKEENLMKLTKRALTLLLAASLAASLLSCGDSQPVTEDTAAADGSTSTQENTEPVNHREAEASAVPADLDFGGKTLTVLPRDAEEFMREFLVEEESGDVVSDAIYARNLAVQEQLNIKLEVIGRKGDYINRDQFVNAVRADVMASATEYDVISYYAYSMPSLSQENLLMNLLELDHLDFDKPWWHKSFTENASVYGKLYMATGDINLTSVTYRTALFFNKRLAEEHLPDTDLYQTVLDGKWTIDCMASLVKDIYNPVYIIGLRLPLGLRCFASTYPPITPSLRVSVRQATISLSLRLACTSRCIPWESLSGWSVTTSQRTFTAEH